MVKAAALFLQWKIVAGPFFASRSVSLFVLRASSIASPSIAAIWLDAPCQPPVCCRMPRASHRRHPARQCLMRSRYPLSPLQAGLFPPLLLIRCRDGHHPPCSFVDNWVGLIDGKKKLVFIYFFKKSDATKYRRR